MRIATRHEPIHVRGLDDLFVYTRRYPDRIEAWIRFKREEDAELYNLPLRFLFETYDPHTYQETQLRHKVRKTFQHPPHPGSSPVEIPAIAEKPPVTPKPEQRPPRRSPVKEAFARAEQRLKAAVDASDGAESDQLVTDRFTGELLQHGIAQRRFEVVNDEVADGASGAKSFNQYQCQIADEALNGQTTQIWGWDLKRAIAEAKAQIGSRVKIEEARRKGQKKKTFFVTVL